VQAFGVFGIPLEKRCAVQDFPEGLGERLALLRSQDAGEIVGVGDNQIEPAFDDLRTFSRRACAPSLQNAVCFFDGDSGHRTRCLGHLAYRCTGCRIHHIDKTRTCISYPFAIEKQRLFEQGRILECQHR